MHETPKIRVWCVESVGLGRQAPVCGAAMAVCRESERKALEPIGGEGGWVRTGFFV